MVGGLVGAGFCQLLGWSRHSESECTIFKAFCFIRRNSYSSLHSTRFLATALLTPQQQTFYPRT